MKYSPRVRIAAHLGVLGLTCAVSAADSASDLQKMEGSWTPSQGEIGGKDLPAEALRSIVLRMKGPAYDVTLGKNPLHDQGLLKLDAAKMPRSIDILGTNGPNLGKTILAIYEFNGDALTICYNLAGTNRPTEFKTANGTALYLVTYHRNQE